MREELAHERGGRWHPGAQRDMMGMSSPEWSRYMHERIGLAEPPEEINRIVVERMLERYAAGPPWIPGALDAVRRIAGRLHARARVVVEPRADRRRARRPAGSRASSRPRSPRRRSPAASPRPTSTSRPPGASASTRPRASRSRTPTTASARRRPPAWRASRSRTSASRPATRVAEADVVLGSIDELTAAALVWCREGRGDHDRRRRMRSRRSSR